MKRVLLFGGTAEGRELCGRWASLPFLHVTVCVATSYGREPVSYTHLDVYKRQAQWGATKGRLCSCERVRQAARRKSAVLRTASLHPSTSIPRRSDAPERRNLMQFPFSLYPLALGYPFGDFGDHQRAKQDVYKRQSQGYSHWLSSGAACVCVRS